MNLTHVELNSTWFKTNIIDNELELNKIMFDDQIRRIRNELWTLKKALVIERMVYNTGINREFIELLIRYKLYKLNEIREFLTAKVGFGL